ncbi:hypothetical protein KOW79_016069 [Hemibagrus wyckioides]|uniref:Uncharacterized protein n=1 Tax=Hemibagrus wyckioides TaxID=337641 RepID=A0A9D3NBB8_9TELE|nr:hypothetical protein KOW79_016069 [Hemibagrus wyckioides]
MLRSAVSEIRDHCGVKEEYGDDHITVCTVKTEEYETSIDTVHEGIAVQLKEEDEEQKVSEETPEITECTEETDNQSFHRVLVLTQARNKEKTTNTQQS